MSFAIVANQSNITIVSPVDTVGYCAKDLINAAVLVSDVQHAGIGAVAKLAGDGHRWLIPVGGVPSCGGCCHFRRTSVSACTALLLTAVLGGQR